MWLWLMKIPFPILTDNANRAIQGNVALHVAQPGGQHWNNTSKHCQRTQKLTPWLGINLATTWHQMAPLALVANFVIRWCHLHCLATRLYHYTATLPWIALLALSVSIGLVSSSARVTSVKPTQGVGLTHWRTTGPIDRTPGTPGSDKNPSIAHTLLKPQRPRSLKSWCHLTQAPSYHWDVICWKNLILDFRLASSTTWPLWQLCFGNYGTWKLSRCKEDFFNER